MTIFPLIWLGALVLAVVLLAVFRPERHVTWLVLIALLVAFTIWVDLPNNPGLRLDTNGDGLYDIDRDIEIRQGLDLAGGVKVLLEADLPEGQSAPAGAMEQVRRIVENRIDALGALEPVVQLQGEQRLIVELPGLDDPESAVELIRETAQLEFVEVPGFVMPDTPITTTYAVEQGRAEVEDENGEPSAGDDVVYETIMTGEILRTADVQFDPTTGSPLVTFTLTPEGARAFGEYTRQHVGGFLAIVLDGVVISAPRIERAITGGEGVITGDFTLEEATRLSTQLRYGALPIPLTVESTSTIGPTLGQISVEQSIRAGLIGIGVVLLFMLVYYRLPGIAAALALVVFALLNLALYKLIPVTMTLPAITGFLISVGTAVDGNILIFERLKEELRRGRRLDRAIEAGFDRAWTSIRDSNLSTLIIAGVLYAFGASFGAGSVRGFAVTLALGLVLNLFTAVTVTRTFLHFLVKPISDEAVERQPGLMGL